MLNVAENLARLRDTMVQAASRYHRPADSVTLVAVSKMQPLVKIEEAIQAGQRHFGENYVQEAIPKITALKNKDLIWHFIGPIQSNKTKLIAEHFQWVHGIDRLKIAERLQAQRSPFLPPLNCCIEVNIDNEKTKSGVNEADMIPLAQKIIGMPCLKLRGFMVIPKVYDSFEDQCRVFERVKMLFDRLSQQGLGMDTLSMGMSHDFEAAIASGATMIRIGTAIFGERN